MTTCEPHGTFPCAECGTVHFDGCPCSLCTHGKDCTPTQLDRIEEKLDKLLERKKPKKALIQEWIEPQHVKHEVWQDFLKHRKEKRKPMKETVYKSLLKRFKVWHKAGHDLDDILQTTIDNDWTGVFEPMVIQKKNGNQQPEVFSQSFQTYDPNAPAEIIDAPVPYAELKKGQ